MRRFWTILVLTILAVGCSGTAPDEEGVDEPRSVEPGKSDSWMAEDSATSRGMLRVVNESTFEVLDDDVGLDKRAAQNIVAARPLATIQELDDVPWVGATALDRILQYAEDNGFIDDTAPLAGSVEAGVLDLVNTASRSELDLDVGLFDEELVDAIVDARPFDSLDQVDAVPGVDLDVLGELTQYALVEDYVDGFDHRELLEQLAGEAGERFAYEGTSFAADVRELSLLQQPASLDFMIEDLQSEFMEDFELDGSTLQSQMYSVEAYGSVIGWVLDFHDEVEGEAFGTHHYISAGLDSDIVLSTSWSE